MRNPRVAPVILLCLLPAFLLPAPTAIAQPPQAPENEKPNPFRIPPRSLEDAEAAVRIARGYRLELLAAEPLVTDPVVLEYDERGRAFVIEMNDYPYTDKTADKPFADKTADLPIGKIRVLEDTDGDGRFDRSTVFARDLSWPTGLAFWKGGVYVLATPDLWYLRDTDGDGVADVRRLVLSGFRKFNVQAVPNNLKWGPDHAIHGAGGTNGAKLVRPDRPEEPPVVLARNDFRFEPRSETLVPTPGGARFGNAFDDFGRRFVANIRNPVQQVVLADRGPDLARNPRLAPPNPLHDAAPAGDTLPVARISPPEPWRVLNAARLAANRALASPRSETRATGFVTSSSGVTVLRGDAHPPELRGAFLVAEPASNAVMLHRAADAPRTGPALALERVLEPDGAEFLASADNWFRPVNFANAPDGSVHLLDMHRETIEHPWSIPDDIKANLDLESGRDRGRIYRLAPPGFPERPRPAPDLGALDTPALVELLAHPNAWHRETAHRLLFERADPAAEPLLRRTLRSPELPTLARWHALWSLRGIDALRTPEILHALQDPAPEIRAAAVRLARPLDRAEPTLRRAVLQAASDPHPDVRFETAFALGDLDLRQHPDANAALARIARRDARDPWLRIAVLSSVGQDPESVLDAWLALPEPPDAAILQPLAAIVGAAPDAPPDRIARRLADLERAPENLRVPVALGLDEGLARRGTPLGTLLRQRTLPPWLDAELRAAEKRLASDAETHPHPDPKQPITSPKNDVPTILQDLALARLAPLPRLLDAVRPRLGPRNPPEVQIAVVRALEPRPEPEIAELLLDAHPSLSPDARTRVVDALMTRVDRVARLLDAVLEDRVPPAAILPARRAVLQNHANPEIRRRALALWGPPDAPQPGRRAEIVEQLARTLLAPDPDPRAQPPRRAPDPAKGFQVFLRECAQCHRAAGRGHELGPDLEAARHRTPAELLVAILDPNREVAPADMETVVELDDGRALSGLLRDESPDQITLVRPGGERETIPRDRVASLRAATRSLMPEGLETRISRDELADLLAWLRDPRNPAPTDNDHHAETDP